MTDAEYAAAKKIWSVSDEIDDEATAALGSNGPMQASGTGPSASCQKAEELHLGDRVTYEALTDDAAKRAGICARQVRLINGGAK